MRRRRGRGDDGAVIVEFALLAPLLFLLIFAIIEFGYGFGQQLDIRHGAREGARLVAVNYGQGLDDGTGNSYSGAGQTNLIVQETCARMDYAENADFSIEAIDSDGDLTLEVGEFAEVSAHAPLMQLTGFLAFALDGVELGSTITTRIERGVGTSNVLEATFADTTAQACP